eukprot:CAMPEP_0201592108 /NCGR_PEP_ID=MMETSP0190_2-20130828/190089_1 /ASSEMBLY_ACC=CAM_ASM_000263 /TAXON_ID=37353 /ORGANISM="Rosalina sp." /LENGTH=459 /DNA_ID=CAMNT_0048050721 /DNA_START=359 /DNA_END=1735 /DNA_ORIENTATION=-
MSHNMMDHEFTASSHGYSPVMHSQNAKPTLGLNIQVHTESQSSKTTTEKSQSRPNTELTDHNKNTSFSIGIPENDEIGGGDNSMDKPSTSTAPKIGGLKLKMNLNINVGGDNSMDKPSTSTAPKIGGLKLKMNLNINVSGNAQSNDDNMHENGTEIVYDSCHDTDAEMATSDVDDTGLNNYVGPEPKKSFTLSKIATSNHNSNGNHGGHGYNTMKMPDPIPIKSSSDNEEEEKNGHKHQKHRPEIELNPTTPGIRDMDDEDDDDKIPRIRVIPRGDPNGGNKSPVTPSESCQSRTMSSTKDENSALLRGGRLDVDNLIERLVGNNSAYHKAYYRNGCGRNAKEYSEHETSKSSKHSISSYFSRSRNRIKTVEEDEDALNGTDDEKSGGGDNDTNHSIQNNRRKSGSKSKSNGQSSGGFMNRFKKKKKVSENKNNQDDIDTHSVSHSREESVSSSYSEPW